MVQRNALASAALALLVGAALGACSGNDIGGISGGGSVKKASANDKAGLNDTDNKKAASDDRSDGADPDPNVVNDEKENDTGTQKDHKGDQELNERQAEGAQGHAGTDSALGCDGLPEPFDGKFFTTKAAAEAAGANLLGWGGAGGTGVDGPNKFSGMVGTNVDECKGLKARLESLKAAQYVVHVKIPRGDGMQSYYGIFAEKQPASFGNFAQCLQLAAAASTGEAKVECVRVRAANGAPLTL